MTTLQISLIVGAGCLWLGYVGCSLFDLYGKGMIRDLENWLDAEVEQGVKLLKENEELRVQISVEGTQGGRSEHPAVDIAPSSFAWVCEKRGYHTWLFRKIDGIGITANCCTQCGITQEPA